MLFSLSPAKNSRQGLGEARPFRICGAAPRGPGLSGSGEWREGSGDTRGGGPCVILSSTARSVPARTWSPSSTSARRAARPGSDPPRGRSLQTRVIARRGPGSRRQPESCPGPDADQHPAGRDAGSSPAGPNSPAPTARHGHHFRSRHPAASSPPAALRPPLSLGAPGLRGPGTPHLPRYQARGSASGQREFPPVALEEGGDPAGQAAAPGGGGTEKGVVDI